MTNKLLFSKHFSSLQKLLMEIWWEWVNANQHFMTMQDLESEVSISLLIWWLPDDYLIIISSHWTDKIYIYSSWRYDANGKTRISILWRCKIWKARLVFQLFKLIKSWQELMLICIIIFQKERGNTFKYTFNHLWKVFKKSK